jgi:hypothetical protein
MIRRFALACLLIAATPVSAKDSLGVFSSWGAFRDSNVPRCYAIAQPGASGGSQYQPFASIGTWPKRNPAVRNQLHVRLSRAIAPGSAIRLAIGGQRFELTGGGGDAWAADQRMDAAIVAAMRSAGTMTISARDAAGRLFTDQYSLDGAATAMDAATVGCARLK